MPPTSAEVLAALEAEVERTATVTDGLEQVISNLTVKLKEETDALAAGGADVSRIQHLLDVATANNARIAALVAANTPAATDAPTPAPVDVPAPQADGAKDAAPASFA